MKYGSGQMKIIDVLKLLEAGKLSAARARAMLESGTQCDLGFARLDLDRARRRGFPEVVYCPGKTPTQVAAIMEKLRGAGQDALATRANAGQFEAVQKVLPDAVFHEAARLIAAPVANKKRSKPIGLVVSACAGTTDIPVAEEAALTAEFAGARVERIYDIGVAGIHRMLKHLPLLRKARVIVAAAGMEGALPSVIGGLVECPVIAVPTSIGYGAGLGGYAALLAMLNSCSPGVCVVNIDNGFGAGITAALINRLGRRKSG